MSKKTAGKELTKKADNKGLSKDPLNPVVFRQAIETLYHGQAAFAEEIAKVKSTGQMPQRLIAIAHVAGQVSIVMEDMQKAFFERVDRLREKGSFEKGRLSVQFKLQSGRRNVQWKAEAIKKAELVAQLKGKKFNVKRYEERVLNAAPKGQDSYKAEIVVDG